MREKLQHEDPAQGHLAIGVVGDHIDALRIEFAEYLKGKFASKT
jgi:hypothetical protein